MNDIYDLPLNKGERHLTIKKYIEKKLDIVSNLSDESPKPSKESVKEQIRELVDPILIFHTIMMIPSPIHRANLLMNLLKFSFIPKDLSDTINMELKNSEVIVIQ